MNRSLPFIVLIIGLNLLSLSAQQSDAVFKVSKPATTIRILPSYDTLVMGRTYDLLIPDMKVAGIKDIRANFGSITYIQSKNGKDIDLKVIVLNSNMGKGSISVLSNASPTPRKKDYFIAFRPSAGTIYIPSGGGIAQPGANIHLMLNRDTLSNNGKISVKLLKAAISLSLSDPEIPAGGYIRKNLMCEIKLMQDTSVITLHSAQDRLSDKVKLGLVKAKAGDKLQITSLENLWIDSKRDDHITPYSFSYQFTVTD